MQDNLSKHIKDLKKNFKEQQKQRHEEMENSKKEIALLYERICRLVLTKKQLRQVLILFFVVALKIDYVLNHIVTILIPVVPCGFWDLVLFC